MNRKRMHAAGQFGGEDCVNHSVTLDSTLVAEGLGGDVDAKVGLSGLPVSGVTLVMMRLIDHPEMFRTESLGQSSCDEITGTHAAHITAATLERNAVTATAEKCFV